MDATGREISTGNAAKIAVELTALSITHNLDLDGVLAVYGDVLDKVSGLIINASEVNAAGAPAGFDPIASLQRNLPGSELVQQMPAGETPYAPTALTVVAPPAAVPQFQPAPVAAPAPVAPVPQFAPQAPAPIPGVPQAGAGDPDTAQAWDVFFTDLAQGTWAQNWEDNRGNKKSDKSPDFKHRSWTRPGERYKVSLYIDGKKNPADVQQRLRAAGVIA